jgi:hypothetical protein
MKKAASYLLFLLCISSLALGQGNLVAPKPVLSVVNGVTRPVANATITVCGPGATGIPCSPVLVGVLFKDAALTQPLPNPFTTDGNGNYQFAVAAGTYTVTETASGFAGYSYQFSIGPNTGGLPPGVAAGSACVSNGIGQPCVYQTKPVIDVRDFAGGSTGAKIDAACASLAGAQGVVVVPSSVATGNSIVGITDNCHLYDYRGTFGPNYLGQEGSAFKGDLLTRSRYTTDHGVGVGTVTPQFTYGEAFAGGTNGSPKTNWNINQITGVFRTPGQHNGVNENLGCFSQGDCIGYGAALFYSSRNNAGGDEGVEGGTWSLNQNSAVPTGTVSAISGTTITMNSQSNQSYLGEKRPLIITTPAKIYSTGSISSISGTPPVLVGTGTAWGALCTTPCSPTDLFFALDADVTSGLKLLVPIRTVTDATHITLNMANEGADMPYPTVNTGTYKIYKGGTVQTLNNDATLASATVDIASDFAVTDTVEQPNDYWHISTGLHISFNAILPGSDVGLTLSNISTTQKMATGFSFSGNWANYFQFSSTTPTTNVFQFSGTGPAAIISDFDNVDNSSTIPFQVSRNAPEGGTFNWTYSKNGDQSIMSGAKSYFFRGFSATSLDFEVQDSTAVPRFLVNNFQVDDVNGVRHIFFSDNQTTDQAEISAANGIFVTNNLGLYRWTSGQANGTVDTGLSRGAANEVDCGNGTQGDKTCAFKAGTYGTATNCAVNSASPAACGSAAAGAVVIPTTTIAYTVNTTSVAAASRITLTWLTFASNLPSAPTCVAPSTTTMPTISNVVAGTSFTITMTSTTGQTCPMYSVEN